MPLGDIPVCLACSGKVFLSTDVTVFFNVKHPVSVCGFVKSETLEEFPGRTGDPEDRESRLQTNTVILASLGAMTATIINLTRD